MGGVAATQLSKMLKSEGIKVNPLVPVDAAFGPFGESLQIPDNVKTVTNFYQNHNSKILSHGYPAKAQKGNNSTNIFNYDMTDKTSGKNTDAHGTMDEDTQQSAENFIKSEMSGQLDGIIKDVTGKSPNQSTQ